MTDQVIQARAPEVSSLRLPLVIVASLIALVAVIAGFRVSGVEIREPDAATIKMRLLTFRDQPDGSVAVIDAKTRVAFDAITGEAGFARGTLRGFARDRRARGIGPEAPLHLMGRADGRLTLFDPQTGRVVDLESFGPVNAAVFKRFLNGVAPQKGAS
jgi:putative photosynthetic complex assembly protein